jgi:hypothetical protein
VATSLPSDQEIARLISTHPETKSINIPLTICSLIQYADVIGASDDSLLQMILIFLKKHSPNTYYQVNPKKSSLKSLIAALTLYASCEEQIVTIGQELASLGVLFGKHLEI